MSDTPRTDAFFRPDAQDYPAARFARQLERENVELLKALEEIVNDDDGLSPELDKARAIITKAKGSA